LIYLNFRQALSIDTLNENYYRWLVTRIIETKSKQSDEHWPPARIPSSSLLGPRGEVVILHNGREYRLRQTQSGKLILTA